MPVTRAFAIALVVAVAGAPGCRRETSFDEEAFRTARRQKSALALAKFIDDELYDERKGDARALLDKHFELALSAVPDGPRSELARAVLTALREGGDPRIGVTVNPPALAPDLGEATRAYFDRRASSYPIARGLTAGVRAAFPHEVIAFTDPDGYGSEGVRFHLWVDVQWRVYRSGLTFAGPTSITGTGAPIEGVGVELTLAFRVGTTELGSVTIDGVAGEGFSYSSTIGFADTNDIYHGMVEAAFEQVGRDLFGQTATSVQ